MATSYCKNNNFTFSSLYCLKAIGAFFVICIHCYSPWILFPIIRTAVPIFFIISGFFLFSENKDNAIEKCKRSLKKICWITLYANLFYYIAFYGIHNIVPWQNLENFLVYLFFGTTLSEHLWYLNAFIETIIIFLFALKYNFISKLFWCIPLFLAIGLLTGKYNFVFNLPNFPGLTRNFVTMGIPGLGIGWLIRKHASKILSYISVPILITFIILIISFIEICYLQFTNKIYYGDFIITTFILAAGFMIIGIKFPTLGYNTFLEFIGKKYSTSIYVFHFFIVKLFELFNEKFLQLPSISFPIIIFFLTIFFLIIWQKCSKKYFI